MKDTRRPVRKTTTEWNLARESSIRRDSGRCTICFSKETLEVHHIDLAPDNHALWNMITLCKKCHVLIHKPKTNEETRHLLKYVYLLRTSHFHPDAILELTIRYLGDYTESRVIFDEEQLNELLANSWGFLDYKGFEEQLEPTEGCGTLELVLARLVDDSRCPVPAANIRIRKDFKKITCEHEFRTSTCDCVGFNWDECQVYSCKKTWCREAIFDSFVLAKSEFPSADNAENLPYIIVKASCNPGNPSGYQDQSKLVEFE